MICSLLRAPRLLLPLAALLFSGCSASSAAPPEGAGPGGAAGAGGQGGAGQAGSAGASGVAAGAAGGGVAGGQAGGAQGGEAGSGVAGSGQAGAGQAGSGAGVELNPGWIGGACVSAASCSSPGFTAPPSCVSDGFPGGFCTQACQQTSGVFTCPDAQQVGPGSLNTITRCIDAAGQPQCAAECDFVQSPETGCRPGYVCVMRQRYQQPESVFRVCLPAEGQRWPGEPAPADDIGQPCNSASDCAFNACLSMPGGYCTKAMCQSAGCPAGSICIGAGSSDATCVKACSQPGDCRDGYGCSAQYKACMADPAPGTWNPLVGADDCAAAWGVGGEKLSPCDEVKDNYVVVRKSARNLALCSKGALVQSFQAGLGFTPEGDKVKQGDGKTPEGVFYAAELLPDSSYHLAYLFSYPDQGDAERGLDDGLISASERDAIVAAQQGCKVPPQNTALGGAVEIHGFGGTSDWTAGCVALDNGNVDQLWQVIQARDTLVVLP